MTKKLLKSIVFIFPLTLILNSYTAKNEIDPFSNSKLHKLISENNISDVYNNLSDVNTKNNLGQTPLHIAAFLNNYIASQILINNKANLNIQDDFGKTPLHLAAYSQNASLVLLLLNNFADIKIKDNTNRTPLDIWPKIRQLIKSKL